MNVIISYLETMFSAYPQTPRLLEAKAELQGMMEDAYTGLIAAGHSENEAVGRVISDFGNLDEVAPVLGIQAEIAPECSVGAPPQEADPAHPTLTLAHAQGYASARERIRFRVSTAVMLFVLSPAVLIFLNTATSTGFMPLSDNAASFMGLAVLLAAVAVGVLLMVGIKRHTDAFAFIDKGDFTANPEATHYVEALARKQEPRRVKALQIAITLWILSPIPVVATSLLSEGTPIADVASSTGVVLLLGLVAAGLGVLLPQTWARDAADVISGTKKAHEKEENLVGIIAGIYWPALTAIFLAWGLIGDAFDSAWVVWPIGGVLFGAVCAAAAVLGSRRRGRADSV